MLEKITQCPSCKIFFRIKLDERRKFKQSYKCKLCKGWRVNSDEKEELIRTSIRLQRMRTNKGFSIGRESYRHKAYN